MFVDCAQISQKMRKKGTDTVPAGSPIKNLLEINYWDLDKNSFH